MEHIEKKLDSKTIFTGHVLTLTHDTVELENGAQSYREVVHHNGGVAVLAIDEQQQVLFVRQFRYPYGEVLLELPAGKLERGEDPAACGMRELEEETGYTAGRLDFLARVYPTPGYTNEVLHLYVARDLTFTCAHPDPDEFLTVEKLSLQKALELCMSGEITDAKTLVALLKYARLHTSK